MWSLFSTRIPPTLEAMTGRITSLTMLDHRTALNHWHHLATRSKMATVLEGM